MQRGPGCIQEDRCLLYKTGIRWTSSLTAMILNLRSLLWYLLADTVVIIAFDVFFSDFFKPEDYAYLVIASIILWLWECRKKRWAQWWSILVMKWHFNCFSFYLLAYVVALTVAFETFLPGLADKNTIRYLFISSFILWLWDCRKKRKS